jgi:hypothetical protein
MTGRVVKRVPQHEEGLYCADRTRVILTKGRISVLQGEPSPDTEILRAAQVDTFTVSRY